MMAIGYWRDDTHLNGYGRRVFEDKVTEGQWDNADFVKGKTSHKADIKNYNPNIHSNAKRVDYAAYIKKPIGVFANAKPKAFKKEIDA